MNIVKSTIKGQILIPATIRKKYHIEKDTPLRIYDEGTRIVIEPMPNDSIAEGKGMLTSKGRVLKTLIADRKKEAKR